MEYSAELKEALEQLAMGIAFDEDRADFSRMTASSVPVFISAARFPHADVCTLKPMLETIADLNRLKQLNLNASLAPSFRAFQHELEA